MNYRLNLRTPMEVLRALVSDEKITFWHRFIAEEYTPPPGKRILLLYPCSAAKPYHKSRLYRALNATLGQLGEHRKYVHVVTVSEPYALLPEEFHDTWDDWYDCPGLFEWWCRKHRYEYDEKAADEALNILAKVVASFLKRTTDTYKHRIAFVRTYTSGFRVSMSLTHRIIVERASKISGVDIRLKPDAEEVLKIVKLQGKTAWDFYGVAHPIAQKSLFEILSQLLSIDH